ncbi:MAG: STAS domain-containing protein [Clostridiales bacterium]|nr:STAS domain-containing protein [Clostridiales bacterium]
MLNITKNVNGSDLKVILEGRLDTTTAPLLEAELNKVIADVKNLTFDLEKLDYISSAGLRVLLSSQKIMNKQGSMVIINTSSEVKEIFDVTGFSDILTIK